MLEWFPYQRAPLPRTHLRYVDLDAVLTDGKVERESRAPGFVLLYYGEETHAIVVQGGEPITALRFRNGEQSVVPLTRVRRKATAEREWADVGFFHAPEPQLRAMYATTGTPAPTEPRLPLDRPESLFAHARRRDYTGVVELRDGRRVHYLVFSDGLPVHGFFGGAGGKDHTNDAESLANRLDRLLQERGDSIVATGYAEVSRVPVQAPAALVDVYGTLIAAAFERVAREVGREKAVQCFTGALERTRERRPALHGYRLDSSGRIVGESCASAEEITDGVVALLFDALTATEREGAATPPDVLRGLTHGNRFVLQAHGFFDRLPWPVSH